MACVSVGLLLVIVLVATVWLLLAAFRSDRKAKRERERSGDLEAGEDADGESGGGWGINTLRGSRGRNE